MAQYPIGTATFTNGSRTVDVTNLESGRLGFFTRGTVVFVGADPTIKVVAATRAIDTLTFELDKQWDLPTGSYAFFGAMTSEAISDAVTDMRTTTALLQDTLDNFDTILTSTDPTVTVGETTVVPFGYIIAQGQSDIDAFINNNQTEIDRLRVMEKIKRDDVFYADFTKDEAITVSDLSKTAQGVASAITYTAPDGQTGITADGRVATAGVDEPAIVYRDGECQGLQAVPQSTNYLKYGSSPSNWTYREFGAGSQGTITTGVTDPSGGSNAADVFFPADAENAQIEFSDASGVAAGELVTVSVFIDAKGQDLTLILRTGSSIQLVDVSGSGWKRYNATFLSKSGNDNPLTLKVRPSSGTTDGGFTIGVAFPQEEQGYPTPYIPTTVSQITRSAANAKITGLPAYNHGFLFAQFKIKPGSDSPFPTALSYRNESNSDDRFYFRFQTPTQFRAELTISNNIIFGESLVVSDYDEISLIMLVDGSGAKLFINGQKVSDVTQSGLSLSEFDSAFLGVDGEADFSQSFSKFKKLVLSPRSITESEAIALTTLEE